MTVDQKLGDLCSRKLWEIYSAVWKAWRLRGGWYEAASIRSSKMDVAIPVAREQYQKGKIKPLLG